MYFTLFHLNFQKIRFLVTRNFNFQFNVFTLKHSFFLIKLFRVINKRINLLFQLLKMFEKLHIIF